MIAEIHTFLRIMPDRTQACVLRAYPLYGITVVSGHGLAYNQRVSSEHGISFRSSGSMGLPSRILLSLFLLVFLAAGLFVGYQIGRETYQKVASRFWQPVSCVVLSSEIKTEQQRNAVYRFAVTYSYFFDGEEYTADQVTLDYRGNSDYGKAQRLAEQFPAAAKATCYVNRENPAEAILQKPSLWSLLGLLFPLPFIGFGAGGTYLIWRPARISEPADKRPLSDTASGTKPGCLGVFFGVFLVMGLVFFVLMFVQPMLKVWQARSWESVPCVVEFSQVRTHSSDDGHTYSVDILYAYEFNGKPYKSNRYHFMGGSSSGYERKAAIVRQYPQGRKTVCYVNPQDPTQAVLIRGVTASFWLGLFPLIFVGVGAGGIFWGLRAGREGSKPIASQGFSLPTRLKEPATSKRLAPGLIASEPVALKSKASPWGKMVASILIALFWNGIISIFLKDVLRQWQRGGDGFSKWFETLFLTPFVVIGLGLIGYVGYCFIALFNPRPRLTVSASAVKPGSPLRLQWAIQGRVDRIRELRLFLEGREEATYQRGTKTRTDKEVFATIEIARLTHPLEMREGDRTMTVPTDALPTFTAPHNKIIWAIRLKGEIPNRPDLDEEYPLTLLPLALNDTSMP